MIFTGGKRSSAVLAACEKRRSGLAPKTTQGPGTKTESLISECPTSRFRRGLSKSRYEISTSRLRQWQREEIAQQTQLFT